MKRISSSKVAKLVLLASVLVLMLALCGCRTRITNNDEVTSVMYDEEGWLTDDYNIRRDELSLPKAKKPLFTGLGTNDEEDYDEYYDGDAEMLSDYDPEDSEDGYEEPEEPEQYQGTTPQQSGTTTPGGRGRVVRGRTVRPSTSTTAKTIEVSLEPNGGTCSADSVKVKTGEKYGALPTPTWEDHEFLGWYTKSSGGTKIGKNTKVQATKNHILYAHWKAVEEQQQEEPKKTYKVSFDKNDENAEFSSGGDPVEITEGGTYDSLPTVKCPGKIFDGWYTEAEGGSRIQSGDSFKANADQTLYAHWSDDPEYYYNYWSDELSGARKDLKDEDIYKYKLVESVDKAEDFLKAGGMSKGSDTEYDYLVYFGDKDKVPEVDNPDGVRIVVIPKEAVKNSTSNNGKLIYQIKLFDFLYGFGDVDKAAEELGVTDTDDIDFAD